MHFCIDEARAIAQGASAFSFVFIYARLYWLKLRARFVK